jgi:DNA-binding transcriptional regulator of glucitol operon
MRKAIIAIVLMLAVGVAVVGAWLSWPRAQTASQTVGHQGGFAMAPH